MAITIWRRLMPAGRRIVMLTRRVKPTGFAGTVPVCAHGLINQRFKRWLMSSPRPTPAGLAAVRAGHRRFLRPFNLKGAPGWPSHLATADASRSPDCDAHAPREANRVRRNCSGVRAHGLINQRFKRWLMSPPRPTPAGLAAVRAGHRRFLLRPFLILKRGARLAITIWRRLMPAGRRIVMLTRRVKPTGFAGTVPASAPTGSSTSASSAG